MTWPDGTVQRTEYRTVQRTEYRTKYVVAFPEPDYEQVFRENYDRLVHTLTGVTGDRESARDCVQDAFIKAFARWRRIRRYDDPVAWIRRVAINRSRDVHRSNKRRRVREVGASTSAGESGVVDPATAVDGSLAVVELLNSLPTQQRRAASLFYIEDLSVSEIASLLHVSPGAVKFHLSEARASLRVAVERQRQESHGG